MCDDALCTATQPPSFGPLVDPMPHGSIAGQQLPRAPTQRQYVGLGTWNSRGVTLEDAVRAMLGDESVYVESPALQVRRLQLRHGKDSAEYRLEMDERVYDSEPRRNWGGLNSFRRSWERDIDAAREANQLEHELSQAHAWEAREVMRGLRDAAPRSEAAAARLAQLLVDRMLPRQEGGLQQMLENLVAHQKVPAEKPWDAQVIWSIVLPDRAVQNYGPNLLVLEPSGRGADLNYVSELLRRGHPLGQQSGGPVTSCNDVGGLNKYDYSDIGQAAMACTDSTRSPTANTLAARLPSQHSYPLNPAPPSHPTHASHPTAMPASHPIPASAPHPCLPPPLLPTTPTSHHTPCAPVLCMYVCMCAIVPGGDARLRARPGHRRLRAARRRGAQLAGPSCRARLLPAARPGEVRACDGGGGRAAAAA